MGAMSKSKVEVVFVLDRSGSMYGMSSDVVGSFNRTIAEQKEVDAEVKVSTVLFNHYSKVIHRHEPIDKIEPLTVEDYQAQGNTALLDALGDSIHHMMQVQENEWEKADRVLFIVNTDGLENASRKYFETEIRRLISTQRKKTGWEFIFFGANINTVETARKYGMNEKLATNFVNDTRGHKVRAEAESKFLKHYAENGEMNEAAFTSVREDFKKRNSK